MRTTLILQDELVEQAQSLTNIKEKTALVHEGLRALIEKKSRERLVALAGSEPKLRTPARRRDK
jgi:hypothetical protein